MANQAKKRLRQAAVHNDRNRARKSTIRTLTKRVLDAIEAKDAALAKRELMALQSKIDKAAKTRTLHPNTARRKMAAFAKRVAAIA